jgi:hypothetical protein
LLFESSIGFAPSYQLHPHKKNKTNIKLCSIVPIASTQEKQNKHQALLHRTNRIHTRKTKQTSSFAPLYQSHPHKKNKTNIKLIPKVSHVHKSNTTSIVASQITKHSTKQ